jgi:hypothetical protein
MARKDNRIMPLLQELDTPQIDESLAGAASKQVPLTVTIRDGQTWVNLHSRALRFEGRHLLIEQPRESDVAPPREFAPGSKLGLSFKLKHYKHLSSATVKGPAQFPLEDGTSVPCLSICCPLHMQRVQRRAYLRADVPDGKIVRASFWRGSKDSEPAGGGPENPVWSGRVGNLSAGGFQLIAGPDTQEALEEGDTVGVRISFGAGDLTLYADAMFRHLDTVQDGQCLLGFQFMGLDQTCEGRQALKQIFYKVSEFLRATNHQR